MVGLQNRYALLNKKFQKSLRAQYVGTRDEYPESKICVEEYPSLKQMAPWNREIDVNRADGITFFRGPKAGFQAPHGYLVFESNQPKQNRRDLLSDSRHLLLIFDGINSKNGEKIDELRKELAEEFAEFMDCYRVTAEYDISSHDQDNKVFGDVDAKLHKKYRANKSCFYLIRPDGVVGFRSV